MTLVQNFPFYSIIIAMFSGILSLALNGRRARNVSLGEISLVTVKIGRASCRERVYVLV